MIRVGYMPGDTESPLEERFAVAFDTYRADNIQSVCQAEAPTRYGAFRLDVLLTSSWGRRVAIELDGAAFHDPGRDILRDAAILDTGHVKRVIRISGRELVRHREHTMYLLAQMEPWCVSERGKKVLHSQMHAAGESEPWFDVSSYGPRVYVPPPVVDDEEDENEEPRYGGLAVLTDHTTNNPHIRRALALMQEYPRYTFSQLMPLLVESA